MAEWMLLGDGRTSPPKWMQQYHAFDPASDPYGFAKGLCGRSAAEASFFKTSADFRAVMERDGVMFDLCSRCVRIAGDPVKEQP